MPGLWGGGMKYFSTFSGIGGFELGIEQAYESNNEHAHIGKKPEQKKRSQGRKRAVDKHGVLLHTRNRAAPLCVGYSEIDPECGKCKREERGKYQPKTLISKTRIKCDTCGAEKEHSALQIYEKNFDHTNYGDITKINEKELPDFDLLVGGFPCQAFSIAGKREGFKDTRGSVFFEVSRIIGEKQPRLLLLENVKGLLSHDKGSTFLTIISTLDELGYDCQWQVLNSKNHGVPQNRERVFIIGHLRGTPRPQVFPFGENDKIFGGEDESNKRQPQAKLASTIRTKEGTRADDNFVILSKKGQKKKQQQTAATLTGGAHSGGNHSDMDLLLKNAQIRRLTPTECERLQGFPDGWTEGLSDTQRYKTLGNAVTVNVVADIMSKIYGT